MSEWAVQSSSLSRPAVDLAAPAAYDERSRIARVSSDALSAALSERDRRILALARRKLGGAVVDFGEAVRGLHEAVEEIIPAGRIYMLGTTELGPIVGSILSGVGITASAGGVLLVRIERDGRRTNLGSFSS